MNTEYFPEIGDYFTIRPAAGQKDMSYSGEVLQCISSTHPLTHANRINRWEHNCERPILVTADRSCFQKLSACSSVVRTALCEYALKDCTPRHCKCCCGC